VPDSPHCSITIGGQCPRASQRRGEGGILLGGGILQFNLPSPKGNDLHSKYIIPALKSSESDGYLTESEIRRMERENLLRILEKTGWKIKGSHGAAEVLGIKPTTLLSRMKKMGIERPEA
jgi:transcriptional regulator of acetoin/glycerol metabolism